ncbi:MAG: orotidine 5-phosphate decarboxylase [Crenarchaeota archaeon]|nr:orotidine 5-phosphate decarboxylase [Thermoproteota archaeon]
MALLQVALDTDNISFALRLASILSSELDRDKLLMEAGTPLVKAWGTLSVKLLKEVTQTKVVADTKTMDVGGFESEIMFKAGADIVTVLGLADDSTIEEAVKTAKKYNGQVMVDLINCPNPVERAKEVIKLGADIILYHLGIDVQKKRGITASDMIDEIKKLSSLGARVAVAGGIKPGRARPLVEAGAEIIIVGSAITKADDPLSVAKVLLEEINT